MIWINLDNVYFIGVGGIGMSALARFYNDSGCQIFGYDKTRTALTRKLEAADVVLWNDTTPACLSDQIDLALKTL